MSIYKTATVPISLRDVCHYLVNESEGGRTANGIGVAIWGKPDLNGQIAAKLLDLYNNGSLERTREHRNLSTTLRH